jgi:hypothetical protein
MARTHPFEVFPDTGECSSLKGNLLTNPLVLLLSIMGSKQVIIQLSVQPCMAAVADSVPWQDGDLEKEDVRVNA